MAGGGEDRGHERAERNAGSEERGHDRLIARTFLIPLGAERGWEVAVCDHFSAMATAIGAKLARGVPRSAPEEAIGGATYTFDVHAAHPQRARVLALLREERARVGALWQEVREHNAAHPVEEAECMRVTFYFGQHVAEPDADLAPDRESDSNPRSGPEAQAEQRRVQRPGEAR